MKCWPAFAEAGAGASPISVASLRSRATWRRNALEGLGIDHRAHVGGQQGRVADIQLGERAADHLDHAIGNAFVHTQQTQRRAALTRRTEGALHHRIDHLLGQGGAVDDHRVDAAGLGDQRHDGAVFRGEGAVDDLGHGGRAGEAHAGRACIGDQRGADGFTRAVQQRQRIVRHAGFVQQRDKTLRDRRRLFGRFGGHAVAGDERRGNLAREDREREIPRADADEHTAAVQVQLVAFAGRAGQRLRGQAQLGLVGVVAAEVHGLAHLGHAVARASCALP